MSIDFCVYERNFTRDGSILWDAEERKAYNAIVARAANERLNIYRLVIAGSEIMVREYKWDLHTVSTWANARGVAAETGSGSGLRWRRVVSRPTETR
jgi:hypothetical protein